MKKTLAAVLVLGTGAALLAPPAVANAKDGDDDRIENAADRRGDDHRSPGSGVDDTPSAGSDDGTPDQGSGDNGVDDTPNPGSDDGTPDQGSGDDPGTRTGTGTGSGTGSDDDRAGEPSRARDGKVDVRRSGQCSADSVWRLRIRVKDDRSRIKWQVKTAVAGENWTYAITDNGVEVAAGTRQTRGRSADFTVQHKRRSGGAGAHDVTAVAQNSVTGETCSVDAVA